MLLHLYMKTNFKKRSISLPKISKGVIIEFKECPAKWGVKVIFSSCKKGETLGSGATLNTSKAAPPILPSFKALYNALLLTKPSQAVLIK